MSNQSPDEGRVHLLAEQRRRKVIRTLIIGSLILLLVAWLEGKSGLSREDVIASVTALLVIIVTDILRWLLGKNEENKSLANHKADDLWIVALFILLETLIEKRVGKIVSALQRLRTKVRERSQPEPAVVSGFDPKKLRTPVSSPEPIVAEESPQEPSREPISAISNTPAESPPPVPALAPQITVLGDTSPHSAPNTPPLEISSDGWRRVDKVWMPPD
jgi:hypothetical protein